MSKVPASDYAVSGFAVSGIVAEERSDVLSSLPAGRREHRLAYAIIAVSTVIFVIVAPFAKVALWPVPAFIPIYQSALLVNDLITAVFLLGQRRLSRSHGMSLLAGGYLFTALMLDGARIVISRPVRANGLFKPGRRPRPGSTCSGMAVSRSSSSPTRYGLVEGSRPARAASRS